jgi:hypothetical protein
VGYEWERNTHIQGYYYDLHNIFFSNDYGPFQTNVETSISYKIEQENLKRETLNTFLSGKLDEMAQIILSFETKFDTVL